MVGCYDAVKKLLERALKQQCDNQGISILPVAAIRLEIKHGYASS
jgi:hypothetical protein